MQVIISIAACPTLPHAPQPWVWLLESRWEGPVDSLFGQGYHGRRNTLTVGVQGMGHWPGELVITALSSTTSLVKLRQPASPCSASYRHRQQTAF